MIDGGWENNIASSNEAINGFFNAFKWNTSGGDNEPEAQKLKCTIGLSKEAVIAQPVECPPDQDLGNK